MKHKYKIQVDQPVPSDDQIGRHKDFGRILADYHNLTQPIYRKPLYKNPKAFIGLVLILTIGALVFFAVDEEQKQQDQQQQVQGMPVEVQLAEANSFLQPPLPSLALPALKVEAEAGTPKAIQLPDGVRLQVPANAFTLPDGSPAEGKIELQVRTADSPAEFIALGAPLHHGSGRISPNLLLQVEAMQDGKPLRLHDGVLITAEWPAPDGFDGVQQQFYLSTDDRHWVGGAGLPEPQQRKPSRAVSLDDGFGVVEYDAQGKVVPKPQERPANEAGATVRVVQFSLDRLGYTAIGQAMGKPAGGLRRTVVFTDDKGQGLRILTLYGITQGSKSVDFLWPLDGNFSFGLDIAPGTVQSYLGFLPDGRVASVKDARPKPEKGLQTMQMQVSEAPVKDLASLAQLLDQFAGH